MATVAADRGAQLRRLPSVERLATLLSGRAPRRLAVAAARSVLAEARERVLAGDAAPDERALVREAATLARQMATPSLRPVINATGVVLHTNLGRAPLAAAAVDAVAAVAAGYCNLEYELESGSRGSRGAHVEPLLRELSGAEAALAVNNNAAAVMLALAALAGGREVIVSRGELVEIGGSFRIPDILAHSGATLVEVGTTNRTRVADYQEAIGERSAAILRVHQSNFSIVGFTEAPEPADLAALAAEHRIAMVWDLGAGALEEVHDEPTLRDAVLSGADVVCSSADKLLGGPQAGVIVGRAEAVERCRRHPLARAMRLDKLQLAALEATLRLHREEGRGALPALTMIDAPRQALEARARLMATAIGAAAEVGPAGSPPGGGALPGLELEGAACLVDPAPLGAEPLTAALRAADPPVIARIAAERVVLDPRTMSDAEAEAAARAVRRLLLEP